MTRTIQTTTQTQTQTTIRRGGRAAFGRDTRGVSVVLGGILMFALVLMLLVLFQVTLVPSLNEASEFDHSERVQKDMEAVQADLLSASATGAPEELTVETGLRYPERAFLVNPPPVAGSMTTAPGSVTLEGFFSDDIEVDDFWTGTNSQRTKASCSPTPRRTTSSITRRRSTTNTRRCTTGSITGRSSRSGTGN